MRTILRGFVRVLALLLFMCPLARAATTTLSSSLSTSTIQVLINAASSGDTILFGPGTYSVSSTMILKCGVTYTAQIQATPSNVILSATFSEETTDIFTMNAGCTSGSTTISYLSSLHAGLIFVNAPNSNLTISHNQVGDLKCCSSNIGLAQAYSPAIYFSDPASGATNSINNATVTYNQLGDSTSCTTPGGTTPHIPSLPSSGFGPGSFMEDTESPEVFQMGSCAGIVIQTSVNGVVIEYNNFFHIEEGVHLLCYGDRCSPGDAGGSGPVTYNVTAQFNDFNQVHRIVWEEQPEAITAVTYQFNSEHDWYHPYYGAFGISMACCANPASFAPFLNTSSNVIAFNTVPSGRYGYGIEAFGTGPPKFTNNLVESPFAAGNAMTYGYNSSGIAPNFNFNTLCGQGFANAGYISQEFAGLTAPNTSGTVESATCPVPQSVAPTISPSAGSHAFPLAVTMTDPGYTSGAQPLGNTGIWYTTDGSTPVPGSGTAKYIASGGTFILPAAATVKAVGMWGTQNQPASYASGFGFTPSSVVSATYTASGTVLTLTSITLSAPSTALTAGAAAETCSLTCGYSDSSTDDCTLAADPHGNGPGAYSSSTPTVASISSACLITPLVAGTTSLKATIGALTSILPVSVTASGGGGGGASSFMGNNQENSTGVTFSGCFNSVYSISPPYATTVGLGHLFLPTDTITSGANYDLLIIAAPTATTEASSPICKGTYTAPSSTSPNAFVNVTMSGCGTIAANTPYWIAGVTNDPSGPNYGFWNCGGSSCTGSAPTTYGTGTYPSYWVCGLTYGTYTGLPSSLSANSNQVSQYVDLVPTGPTLVSAYQGNTPNAFSMVPGTGYQQHCFSLYTDGVILSCDTTDARGTAVTAWTSSNTAVLTVGAVGSGTPGLVNGVGYGQASSNCTVTGSIPCTKWVWTVTNQPATTNVINGAILRNSQIN
jgi:hypothetical protein